MKFKDTRIQFDEEWNQFLNFIEDEHVKSYLEIGSRYGGTLWSVAQVLPEGARLVAVDLPSKAVITEPDLRACVDELKQLKYDAHLFLSDSTNQDTIAKVRALGPFDLVFIDGNHFEQYVRSDWKHYGPLGRIVAFHDISWQQRDPPTRVPIHVPIVWNEIKQKYKYKEIKIDRRDNGIGILWNS